MTAQPPPLAAVDVGANSAHLLVACERDGRIEPGVDDSALLGLGGLVDETGVIGRAATGLLAAVLARFVALAAEHGVRDTVIVGTEPLRAARDAAVVVEEVTRATGEPLHVLAPDEEGMLTLIGVLNGRRPETSILVADVGGGSTELVSASPGRPPTTVGFGFGSARMTARFISSDPPSGAEIEAASEAARRAIPTPPEKPAQIVAVGGTASNVLKLLAPGAPAQGTVSRHQLDDALAILARVPASQVAEAYGMRPSRAAMLPAGAAILAAILDCHGHDGLLVVDGGIREGLVHAVARAGPAWRDRLPELAAGWRD